jgi:5-methylcytosine-specific restriction protein B
VLKYLRELGYTVPDPAYSPAEKADHVSEPRPSYAPQYTLEQCAADLSLPRDLLESWIAAISRKGQAIIYGPPGTGKTYVARHLARHLVGGGGGHVDLVQFHGAYSYEDFLQGLRPTASEDGQLKFAVLPGRFMEFCKRASESPGLSVIIIDEINRANLSQVFGELMYLLEYRDMAVPLAAGGSFRIPPNVRIIGTMNTADRSIAMVDHALRRRFAFLRLDPQLDVLERFHAAQGNDVSGLVAVIRSLNEAIGNPSYSLGVSYFLRPTLREDLPAVWSHEIEPYLEEYFFDDPKRVDAFRWPTIADKVAF